VMDKKQIAYKTIKVGEKSSSPILVVLMGLPGSGKSYVASFLHKKYGYSVLSGESITYALLGTEKCTKEEYKVAYQILQDLASELLNEGYSVVIDGTNLSKVHREQIYTHAAGKRSILLYLLVNEDIAMRRISEREENFTDMQNITSKCSPETFQRFQDNIEEPTGTENAYIIKSDQNMLTEVARVIEKLRSS
jgi:predicted kinase